MTQTAPPPEQPAAQAAPALAPWHRRPLFWSLLLLLLLALLAGWMVWTQWQAVQARNAELAALAETQRGRNAQYEAERARLADALKDDPCKAEDHLRASPALPGLVPDPAGGSGQSGEPLRIPPPRTRDERADPKPGAQAQDPPAANTAPLPPARDIRDIADLMEQATVMVLAQGSKGTGMGSGFFIAPDLVFTNAHVAMDPNSHVFVCNKATGSLLPGKVAAFNASGGRDYALIRLEVKPNVRPLAFKEQVRRTDRISAWGFPGAVTSGDPKFAALLRGDLKAAPEVVFTEGSVSVVLERTPPLIVHSAVISQGNSGGPLVDEHGAVLGINTLIRLDDESYRQSSMALTAADMIAFLKAQGVSFILAEPAKNAADAPRDPDPAPARTSGGKE